MNRLSTKHFIGLEYATINDINLIINTALTFREILDRPIKKIPSLKGKNIVNLFFENSTRTKLS
jgi:Aspartate carbamoyltransferase, catalytic chain